MKVRVLLFAAARQRVGASQIECELADGAVIADLRRAMLLAAPELGSSLDRRWP